MPDGSAKLKSFFSNNLFLGSFENMIDIPKKKLPEICFIGRSNTGKSSIINAITKNKNLAKTSKTPGCTKSVNIFEINNKINIADLPGYGYAKTSKIIREKLTDLIESYLCSRLNITRTFVLIDCKIGIKDSDIDIFDLIFSINNNFCVVLTKIDKCSENFIIKQEKSIRSLMSNYKKNFDQIFLTSSKKNKGILDLQKIIYKLSTKNEI